MIVWFLTCKSPINTVVVIVFLTSSSTGIMSAHQEWANLHVWGRVQRAAVHGARPHRTLQPLPLPARRHMCGSAGQGGVQLSHCVHGGQVWAKGGGKWESMCYSYLPQRWDLPGIALPHAMLMRISNLCLWSLCLDAILILIYLSSFFMFWSWFNHLYAVLIHSTMTYLKYI